MSLLQSKRKENKISRLLFSIKEQNLQIIFYHKLPTEIIRIIGEYLYQSKLIKIKYKKKSININNLVNVIENHVIENHVIENQVIENKVIEIYNCPNCFLYNYIKYLKNNEKIKKKYCKFFKIRTDVDWFSKSIKKNELIAIFNKYYYDIFKFILPKEYNMYLKETLFEVIIEKRIF